jgi:hypothetical protein
MSDAATMLVYENGVPRHVQVHVGPDQAVVDYLDGDGAVVSTVVHDVRTIQKIAKQKGLSVQTKDLGGSPAVDPAAQAIARTKAESTGAEPPDETPAEPTEPALEDLTRDQLYEKAQEAEIEGRSKLDKDELVAALSNLEADEEE